MKTRYLLLAILATVAVGCGGGSGDTTSPPTVASVAVTPDVATVVAGSTTQLTASVRDAKGNVLTGHAISWSSSGDQVATVSSSGLVTTVSAGTAQIRATSDGVTGQSTITVTPAPVSSVTLSTNSATLVPNQPLTLTATTKDAQGGSLSGRIVNWSSNAEAVATVNQSGAVTAIAPGTALITALSETKSAQATITVVDGGWLTTAGGNVNTADGNVSIAAPVSAIATPTAITVSAVAAPVTHPALVAGTAYDVGPATTTLAQPVTVTIRYSQASIGALTPSLFRLHRLTNGVWVPIAGSSVNVTTRTATGQSSAFGTYAVVGLPPIVAVTVTPTSTQLLQGGTQQLSALPRNSAGVALTGRVVTWQSSDIGRATVSNTGLVTAIAAGTATITATSEGVNGTAAIEIVTATNIPTFSKPFTDEWPVGNFVDHNIPKEFVDVNDTFTTYWGEVLPGRGGMVDGHSGHDFIMPVGTPIFAVADGKVVLSSTSNPPFFCPPLNRNVTDQESVVIEHTLPGGLRVSTYYTHLSRVDVTLNQQVTRGQPVGLSGNTGCSGAPHLHFEAFRVTTKNTTIDPYGWTGAGVDPWEQHPDGTASIQLWRVGEAPLLWKQQVIDFATSPASAAAVIAKIVYQGVHDDVNPNNEYIEIALDTRVAPQQSLDGYRLRADKSGANFLFPAGIVLSAARPSVRVYTGSGTASATSIFMGQPAGIWSNLRDDCARLVSPAGGQYRINMGNGCPLPGPAIVGASILINPAPAPFEVEGARPPAIRPRQP